MAGYAHRVHCLVKKAARERAFLGRDLHALDHPDHGRAQGAAGEVEADAGQVVGDDLDFEVRGRAVRPRFGELDPGAARDAAELREHERPMALSAGARHADPDRVAPLRHRLHVALLLPERLPRDVQRLVELAGVTMRNEELRSADDGVAPRGAGLRRA